MYAPTINTNDSFPGSFEVEKQKGKHLIKYGASLTRRYDQDYQSPEARIDYQFTNGYTSDGNPNDLGTTGDPFASFLLGYPNMTMRDRYLILPTYKLWEFGSFAQDDYRITNKLTLNLGVRWDYYSPPSEERNRITNFNFKDLTLDAPGQDGFGSTVGVPKRLRNWGPRFGFAYQLDPKTVVRGGLGINYNPQMMGSGGAFRNAPYTTTYTWQQTNVTLGNSFSAPIPPLVHDSQNKLARINLRRLNDL